MERQVWRQNWWSRFVVAPCLLAGGLFLGLLLFSLDNPSFGVAFCLASAPILIAQSWWTWRQRVIIDNGRIELRRFASRICFRQQDLVAVIGGRHAPTIWLVVRGIPRPLAIALAHGTRIGPIGFQRARGLRDALLRTANANGRAPPRVVALAPRPGRVAAWVAMLAIASP